MNYPQEAFAITKLHSGSLIQRRRKAVSQNTLLYQLDVLKKTGRYDAFKLQWHHSYNDPPDVWPIPNHLFWDSDIAKWIEGACYFLRDHSNHQIESAIQELVDMIRHAQLPDGYLNIHYQVVEPGKRFTNVRDMHELYNAGHLIEAALAHHDLYNSDDLLEPMLKYVELLCKTFGSESSQIHGYPGHPEIELALLRLYERTGKHSVLQLAEYFINERGNPHGWNGEHYYVQEAKARQEDLSKRPGYWPTMDCLWYYQAHKPIIDQETVEGHSVRAMYLLTAVADLVRIQEASKSSSLLNAVKRLWRNMVDKKMYVTGGIGSIKQWEGFGIDYYLPQGTDEGGCYSETCAAIGVMMLAERLLQIDLDGEHGDIMELCLYNSVLTGMSSDGTAFTYDNQLASSDQDPSKRRSWFTCACCPPNVMRLLGQIGGYATTWKVQHDRTVSLSVHLYVSSTSCFTIDSDEIVFTQQTNWPWSGDVQFDVKTSSKAVQLDLRIPGWAEGYKIKPDCPEAIVKRGYLSIPARWMSKNPSFSLSIPVKPRMLSPHPYTNQDIITVARGPIIYCVEDVDNDWVKDHFKSLCLNPHGLIEETQIHDEATGDEFIRLTVKDAARVLRVETLAQGPAQRSESFDSMLSSGEKIEELHFVPYYFRANRKGKGQMRVGLRRWENALRC